VSDIVTKLKAFVEYVPTLKGGEKGGAHLFCERLFQAFGHKGLTEGGAELEFRLKRPGSKATFFADLVWKPRLLLEMKKRGEKLHLHYQQAFDYWVHLVPNRPRYVVLCNFDEFWIYDFDRQISEPVDIVKLKDLPRRYDALAFLFPDPQEPVFENDLEAVSRETASALGELYNSLIDRGEPREKARRFLLQLVVAMFSEDIDLLPKGLVMRLLEDCRNGSESTVDMLGGLFRQMDNKKPATAGRYKGVRYFNGGLFNDIDPIDLTPAELDLLIAPETGIARRDWSRVDPSIFGTLFQSSMKDSARHAQGAHFTSEADIQRIVLPTIVRPWQARIDAAKTATELATLRSELLKLRVLDPACGSGNFLYVAYREIVRLETRITARLAKEFKTKEAGSTLVSLVPTTNFFGIDIDGFGVELAKVTLSLSKQLALKEAIETFERDQLQLPFPTEALPLDNLDENIVTADALFTEWPEVDVIIGNPPFQSKNKAQEELGRPYMNRLRRAYPKIDGRSDYCVYWIRKTHDHLKPGQRAGLVGTNTIRQNYSRMSGLDYVVAEGGTITEAVSSMPWSGDAVVHVSVVNWIKGEEEGPKRLSSHDGSTSSTAWRVETRDEINSSLSFEIDLTSAVSLTANAADGGCYQGQTQGHDGFLVERDDALDHLRLHPEDAAVLHPFLIGDDLLGSQDGMPSRHVIDFHGLDKVTAKARHPILFDRVQKAVLSDRMDAAQHEKERNAEVLKDDPKARVNRHHEGFLKRWWQLSYSREDMLAHLQNLNRYIVCSRATRRPVFEFVHRSIRPGDALSVFGLDDDYSFGILQSTVHWLWFVERCSTLKSDFRYTSNTVFDTFPWPQSPTLAQAQAIANAARELRRKRWEIVEANGVTLRELYRARDGKGAHPLDAAHEALDKAVRAAYGMKKRTDPLAHLLELNQTLAVREANGTPIIGPGLPPAVTDRSLFVSTDCIGQPSLEETPQEAA